MQKLQEISPNPVEVEKGRKYATLPRESESLWKPNAVIITSATTGILTN